MRYINKRSNPVSMNKIGLDHPKNIKKLKKVGKIKIAGERFEFGNSLSKPFLPTSGL